jgi:CubicO group peptidase (beta-lactamase class C family)
MPTPVPAITPTIPAPSEPVTCGWPTGGWQTSTPEEQGIDSEILLEMFEYFPRNQLDHGMLSLLIIRNGCLVMEAYFHPYRADLRTDLWSCTKSVSSMLIGIALAQGHIESLEQPVLDFFPGETFQNVDEFKRSMNVKDLLTMRAGLDWPEAMYPYDDQRNLVLRMIDSDNWVHFVLDRRMIHEPGLYYEYNTGASHLLSAIIQQSTGVSTTVFAQETLFDPLGISDLDWLRDPQGIASGGHGLLLTPRDMAKLGYLYLRQGEWDGEQIVPAEWVKASIQPHTSMFSNVDSRYELAYGYQWWVLPDLNLYEADSFGAIGYQGQFIFVVPEKDIVVVLTQWDSRRGHINTLDSALWYLTRFALYAAKSDTPLPPNPEGVTRLQAEIEAVGRGPSQ